MPSEIAVLVGPPLTEARRANSGMTKIKIPVFFGIAASSTRSNGLRHAFRAQLVSDGLLCSPTGSIENG